MDPSEKDEVPILSETREQPLDDSQVQRHTSWTWGASLSLPTDSVPSYDGNNLVGYTGPLKNQPRASFLEMSAPQDLYPVQVTIGNNVKESLKENLPAYDGMNDKTGARDNYSERNEHLLKSGQLGMCDVPYCTTCPSDCCYKRKPDKYDWKHDLSFYEDSKGWVRRFSSSLYSCLPGIMNPHARVIQQWNKFFVISCLFSTIIDPIIAFVLTVNKDHKCIGMDMNMAIFIVVLRSLTDAIYLIHIGLQFRLAYTNPESRVVGAGDLVDEPKKIAMHYLTGSFFIDLFAALPFPQIMAFFVLPNHLGYSGANFATNVLYPAVLVPYMPRLYRLLHLLADPSLSDFILIAWPNFVSNLLTFVLAGHVVGSAWYLFGLQRVNHCLRNACNGPQTCKFMYCGYGDVNFSMYKNWRSWANNANATACFNTSDNFDDGFPYGIYKQVVTLATKRSGIKRYVYSLFWGFQQLSTLAGNQVPSDFQWEVLFTMAITGVGLFLVALLIGNVQHFLQSLERRRLETWLRQRDVEQWMSNRHLSDELRRKVRETERYSWAATRGLNEETSMENLPEELQREVRKHLFRFLEKIPIFAMMEEPILDSIREKLRQRNYIRGSCILYPGGLIEKMVFIVRGKMESIGDDGVTGTLAEGSFCGEELLIWCLDHSSASEDAKKNRIRGERPYSTKVVKCLTNVDAFILRDEDLEEVTNRFGRYLSNPLVQRAIRYETPYWRSHAATCIQVAWRYRKKRLNRAKAGSVTGAE